MALVILVSIITSSATLLACSLLTWGLTKLEEKLTTRLTEDIGEDPWNL